ncbi:MAG: permease [Thermoplasmata archaeon]
MAFEPHPFVGSIVIAYVILAFFFDITRKRSKKIDDFLNLISIDKAIPDKVKIWFMGGFAIACIYLYTYCAICKFYGWDGTGDDRLLLDWIYRDLLGILPWFVWGCIVAGFIMKYLYLGKLRLPKSMLGAGMFASVIPICSCAAVPMAHGMMLGRQMRVRAVITFLIVVPVLSPIVMIMASSQIGIEYLIVEIVSVFALAMVTGIFIEKLAGVKGLDEEGKGCYSCEGCKTTHMQRGRNSALLAAWDQFLYLLKFIMLGIVIGAAISVFIEPADLASLFGGAEAGLFNSIPGLVLIVLIAIPMFICSGEDVLILAPLLAMGLPLGHAIAFAIAGNAICITAIPVLQATFGKKVTALIVLAFFVGSIAIGLVINVLVWALGF